MTATIAMQTFLGSLLWLLLVADAKTSVVPPPWANPSSNPCAAQPRGWQLLYWPLDGKCYKIFQIGPPCPETMELGPSAQGGGIVAECRCPPGTAQSPRDALCHPIFSKASCSKGQYFAPVPDSPNDLGPKRRWGICKDPEPCLERGKVFWPRDGKCYPRLARGPCPKGQLLTLDEDNTAICTCSTKGELNMYHWPGENGGCYEHYTKGPCTEIGELFLPGGICGCKKNIPHYHEDTKMCYPLGEIGPCLPGHHFTILTSEKDKEEEIYGKCICKPNHVPFNNGLCYRLHTRGPCEPGDMLINSTSCIRIPCKRGRLYFPNEKTCYKIGSKGPCPNGQVVLYDQNVRPSIDGISYNGICGCTKALKIAGKCFEEDNSCENSPGMIFINKICYKLYTQGPCGQGEWLIARRRGRSQQNSWEIEKPDQKVRCECRPGYKRVIEGTGDNLDLETNTLSGIGECQPPAVGLAKFLNDNIKSTV